MWLVKEDFLFDLIWGFIMYFVFKLLIKYYVYDKGIGERFYWLKIIDLFEWSEIWFFWVLYLNWNFFGKI